jgi:hypothetical protein
VSAQPNGRLRVLVATNLFGNIAAPEFSLKFIIALKRALPTYFQEEER